MRDQTCGRSTSPGLSCRPRTGITLLEVLVAMMIMTVGLLGMAALIPLGRLELAEGNIADNAATLGRWAFRDLSVRGYLRPEMWVDPVSGESVVTGTGYNFVSQPPLPMPPPIAPIVIDPLMITPSNFGVKTANASLPATGPEGDHRNSCRLFPYSLTLPGTSQGLPEGSPSAPRMARVTLRMYPANLGLPVNDVAHTMRYDAASRWFRSTDDLVFSQPTDPNERPVQVFATNKANSTPTAGDVIMTPSKGTLISSSSNTSATAASLSTATTLTGVLYRQFQGAYSWFVVVEPSMAEAFVPTVDDPNPLNANLNMLPTTSGPFGSTTGTRQFRVWVVVCLDRDLRTLPDPTITLPGENGLGERMVWVDFMNRNTARLRLDGLASEGAAVKALDVKTNQWIAVLGRYREPALTGLTAGGSGAANSRYVMEWYRITGVAERPLVDRDRIWYREVTLAGRDFAGLGFQFIDEPDGNRFGYQGMSDAGGQTFEPMTGWGILVSGVRGVYEKSVFVDSPSLWSMPDQRPVQAQ